MASLGHSGMSSFMIPASVEYRAIVYRVTIASLCFTIMFAMQTAKVNEAEVTAESMTGGVLRGGECLMTIHMFNINLSSLQTNLTNPTIIDKSSSVNPTPQIDL